MILDVLCEEDKALLASVAEGLRLLEDDALGGGGSRGSGRVGFSGSESCVARQRLLFEGIGGGLVAGRRRYCRSAAVGQR